MFLATVVIATDLQGIALGNMQATVSATDHRLGLNRIPFAGSDNGTLLPQQEVCGNRQQKEKQEFAHIKCLYAYEALIITRHLTIAVSSCG